VSQDERITGRPAPMRVPEFDEDAAPRPMVRVAVDLSGNYRDEPWRWLWYGIGEWGVVFWPLLGFVLFMALWSLFCWPLFFLFLRAPLTCEAFLIALHVLRDRRVSDPMKDNGYWWVGRVLGSTCLQSLLIAFALAIGGTLQLIWIRAGLVLTWGPTISVGVHLLCGLLLAGGTGYLFLRFSFANSLIADQDMGVFPAFAASWQLTRGHELALAAFYFLLGLLFLVGLLAFGVGLFFTVPLIVLAEASLYLHATGQARDLTLQPPPRSEKRPPE
jgi:hypothetical protein